jgi:hypothetical protein
MLGVDPRSLAVGWFLVVIAIANLGAEQTASGPYAETIGRALALLPKQPAQVLVVDATRAARAADAHGRRVQAFVRHGENVVYLIAQGDTLQRGQKGAGVFDYVLATIIWHEMAHLAGAGEREAQRQEEDLWAQYLAAGHVDTRRGLNYLALLKKRQ